MSTLINLGGLATGVIGIPDGSGWYTFYGSLNLALAAATSGDTIVFFDDFVESTSTVSLVDGVDINLNGHSYILDTADAQNTFTNTIGLYNVNVYNGKIIRRNAVPNNVTDGVVISTSSATPCTLNLFNVEVIQEADACVLYGINKNIINGGTFIGGSVTLGFSGQADLVLDGGKYFVTEKFLISNSTISNSYFKTDGDIVSLVLFNGSKAQNVTIESVFSGGATVNAVMRVQPNSIALNCSVFSNSIIAIEVSSAKMYDTSARSINNTGINVNNGSFISNCSSVSSTKPAISLDRSEVHNSYSETLTGPSSVTIGQDSTLYNSSIISNNASGVAIFLQSGINKIAKCTIGMANISGSAIDGNLGVNAQIVNCVSDNGFSGSLINTTNVTNIQNLTQDNFGNILIG